MKHNNLWAPWRIEYLKSLSPSPDDQGCFFCNYWAAPDRDREHLVLWRTPRCLVIFNRFPYTAGHLLIAPADHLPDLADLPDPALLEIMRLAADAQKALAETIQPQGFNLGLNIHRCAGAGLPGHLHLHLVPRWDGDTNFLTTCAHTRLISQSLDDLYDQLKETSRQLNLPTALIGRMDS